jgi:hypothetical protein
VSKHHKRKSERKMSKIKGILIGLLIIIGIGMIYNLPVHAFIASNWVWPSESPYRNPHKYYATTSIWGQFTTAISDWSGTDFGTMQMNSSPDDAVVTVRRYNYGDTGLLGCWEMIDYSGWTLFSARISLNSYYENNLNTSQKRGICGHELGHDLGLDDLTSIFDFQPPQLMWQYAPDNWARGVYTPQNGQNADIWGVNSVY